MDKETIKNYLKSIKDMIYEGKIVQAHSELDFVIRNLGGERNG